MYVRVRGTIVLVPKTGRTSYEYWSTLVLDIVLGVYNTRMNETSVIQDRMGTWLVAGTVLLYCGSLYYYRRWESVNELLLLTTIQYWYSNTVFYTAKHVCMLSQVVCRSDKATTRAECTRTLFVRNTCEVPGTPVHAQVNCTTLYYNSVVGLGC